MKKVSIFNRDPYSGGINCSSCGKFVGEDGYKDIYFDNDTMCYEIGYPKCKRCIDKKQNTTKEVEG